MIYISPTSVDSFWWYYLWEGQNSGWQSRYKPLSTENWTWAGVRLAEDIYEASQGKTKFNKGQNSIQGIWKGKEAAVEPHRICIALWVKHDVSDCEFEYNSRILCQNMQSDSNMSHKLEMDVVEAGVELEIWSSSMGKGSHWHYLHRTVSVSESHTYMLSQTITG